MTQTHEPEMLEKIQTAVRPLTDRGEFHLETIAYGTYHSDYVVQLRSQDSNIIFHGNNVTRYPEILCFLYVYPIKKFFHAQYLFPAMDIVIPLSKKNPAWDVDMVYHLTSNWKKRPITEPDVLDFYEDLDRWCRGIQKNLSEIRSFFTADNIDETIRLYSLRFRKREKTREIFQMLYPVPEPEKSRKDCFRKPVADLVDILVSMRPLDNLCHHSTITCHMEDGRVDVTQYFKVNEGCKLLFHSNDDGSTDLFFILCSWLDILRKNTGNEKTHNPAIFSYDNVLKLLHIDYSYHPKGFLKDIREYCQLISDNGTNISTAFSKENVEETYRVLNDTTGNNEDGINYVLDNLNDLID